MTFIHRFTIASLSIYKCAECGALVESSDTNDHIEWHEKLSQAEETDCTCGWGGTHDPDNPKCAKNEHPAPPREKS